MLGGLWQIEVDGKSDMLFGANVVMAVINLVFGFEAGELRHVPVVELLHFERLDHEVVAFPLPLVGSRCLWSWNIGLLKIIVAEGGETFMGGSPGLGVGNFGSVRVTS